jgi:hypothetical protein
MSERADGKQRSGEESGTGSGFHRNILWVRFKHRVGLGQAVNRSPVLTKDVGRDPILMFSPAAKI